MSDDRTSAKAEMSWAGCLLLLMFLTGLGLVVIGLTWLAQTVLS